MCQSGYQKRFQTENETELMGGQAPRFWWVSSIQRLSALLLAASKPHRSDVFANSHPFPIIPLTRLQHNQMGPHLHSSRARRRTDGGTVNQELALP